MDRCLLDTSTLSDLIQPPAKRSAVASRHLTQYLSFWGRITFSHISCYEVLRGLRKKKAEAQVNRIRELCDRSDLLPVTLEVFDRAAELWAFGQRTGVTVDDADLVIAATAQIEGLAIASANPKHFAWIEGLTISNWRDP